MPERPVVKRFFQKKCTVCSRALVKTELKSSKFPGLVYPHGEEVWCRRCVRDHQLRAPWPPAVPADDISWRKAAFEYLVELELADGEVVD